MSGKNLYLSREDNINSLLEMQESLLILQNSYDAITIIIGKFVHSQNSAEQQVLEVLRIEVQLTRLQIERLHNLIYHQLTLIEKTS